MTDLPPLSLDDVRVTAPNIFEEAVFDASETWWAACDKIADGYSADDVAELLLTMNLSDTSLLWQWWRDECMAQAQHGVTEGRDATCSDLGLVFSLNQFDARKWRYPLVDGATVLPIVDERAMFKAENAKLRALLAAARDTIAEWAEAHVWREEDGEAPSPQHLRFMAEIAKALGE